MAEFINYIIDSPIQPVKTNVLWVKKGVLHYYNKKWIPIAGGGSGNITYPIIDGEGDYSAVLAYSDNKALNISSVALGYNTISRNFSEASFGVYNSSYESDDPSIATLFSVGNGSKEERKNAFEIKENGDIYIFGISKSLQNTIYELNNSPLIKRVEIIEKGFEDLKEQIKSINALIISTKQEIDDSLKEYESSFSVTAEEIRAEVSRVETDLDGKITKSNSLISQTADEIRTEVSRVELDINGSIREANSRITQTAEEIKSEVYDIQTTLDGKINENSSKIEQTSEEIKSSVKLEQFNALTGAVDQGFTEVKQSVEGIITTIGDRTGKTTSITEDIEGVTVSLGTVEADIESLKKQSDGAIDTHFGTVTPTLDNEPAVNWDTEELKKEHIGDLYYNNTTGEAFRWSYDPETETHLWVELTDSALTEALGKISKLEEAIDGKVTIFYSEPSNYKEGDLWFVHIDYPSYHFIEGQLLTAIAASNAFDASHWEDKTNFASHAEVTESVTQLNNYIDGAFSDNILTVAEIKQIKEAKKNFESLFSEVKESYSYLVISAAATDSDKTALTEAYNNLTHETNGSYTLLIAAIDALIALDKEEGDDVLDIGVVKGLLAEYESAYELFSKDLTAYYTASARLTEGIQNYLSSASDYINDIMSDNVLSPIEKEQLLNIWRQIAEEFTANRGIAYNYKLLSISDTEKYIKRTDIYPEDSPYHSIYESYENAYNVVKNIFTAVNEEGKNIWGFDDLSVSTATPEDLTTVYISESLDAYYKTLSPFAEMIAEITIAITDAHDEVIKIAESLQKELQPSDEISVIGKGVILSSVIGVQSEQRLVAALNASKTIEAAQSLNNGHGRIVFAGGITDQNDWNSAKTVIYEDGYVHFKWGEIDDAVEIGNALVTAISSGNIDLFSYPETVNGVTTLVPLFQVTKDETGKIIAVHSVYDFYANKDLTTLGETSSGGIGEYNPVAGTVTGIVIGNNDPYYPNEAGIIDLTDAFEAIGGGGIDVTQLEAYLTSNNYINSVNGIVSMLGYTPANAASLNGYATQSWVEGKGYLTSVNSEYYPALYDYGSYIAFDFASSFKSKGQGSGYIEFYDSGWYNFRIGSLVVNGSAYVNGNEVIHSGNYSSYALPLSGGTISGTSANPLIINTTASTSFLSFQQGGVNKADVGWDNGLGAYIANINSGYTISIKDEGTPVYYNGKSNTLIHSGNIGSQSVASANLLTPTDHGGVIVYNNSWANRVLLRSGWESGIGDYIEFGVPSGTANNASMRLALSGAVTMSSTLSVGGDVFFKTAGKLDAYGNFHFTSPTTGSWAIVRGNGNDALLIDNTTGNATIYGNVGIGVTSPQAKLHVHGTTRIQRLDDARSYLDITSDDVSVYYNGYDSDGWCNHHFQSNGITRMTIYGLSGDVTMSGNLVVAGDVASA